MDTHNGHERISYRVKMRLFACKSPLDVTSHSGVESRINKADTGGRTRCNCPAFFFFLPREMTRQPVSSSSMHTRRCIYIHVRERTHARWTHVPTSDRSDYLVCSGLLSRIRGCLSVCLRALANVRVCPFPGACVWLSRVDMPRRQKRWQRWISRAQRRMRWRGTSRKTADWVHAWVTVPEMRVQCLKYTSERNKYFVSDDTWHYRLHFQVDSDLDWYLEIY